MCESLASKTLCIMKFCTIIFYGGDNFLPAALLPLLEAGGSTLVYYDKKFIKYFILSRYDYFI